jgi:hypothetical protein
MVLPILFICVFLAATNRPFLGESVEHGELFLAAANCAVSGAVILLARTRKRQWAGLASALVILLLAAPCYAAWALLAVRALAGESYSSSFAIQGGLLTAAVSGVTSLVISISVSRIGVGS